MNWFRSIKIAMPIAQVTCPSCGSGLLVDVKQKTTTLKSEPYEVRETGQCVTKCQSCSQFMLVHYDFDFTKGFFAHGTTSPITPDEAKEAIKTLLYVTSSPE